MGVVQRDNGNEAPSWSALKPLLHATLNEFFSSGLQAVTMYDTARLHYHTNKGRCSYSLEIGQPGSVAFLLLNNVHQITYISKDT